MKCKSCGKVLVDNAIICDNCGFDVEAFKKLKVVKIEEDPDVPEQKKSNLLDAPILAFVFGIIAVLSSLLFVAYLPNIVILYLFFVVLFNFLTFTLANKPTTVKLKPVANVGKGMAYFSIGFILFKVIYEIIGLLFF